MRKITIRNVIAIIILVIPVVAHADFKKFQETVTKTVSSTQTLDDVKAYAVLEAKRQAIEEAGVYIKSVTVVKNGVLTDEDIMAIASGIVKTEIIDSKTFIQNGQIVLTVVVNALVDNDSLKSDVDKALSNKDLMNSYKELEKKLDLQVQQNKETERKLWNAQADQIKIEQKATQYLIQAKQTSDPDVEYQLLTEAIKIGTKNPEIYYRRSICKPRQTLEEKLDAISDLTMAIKYSEPISAAIFSLNRAAIYYDIDNYDEAESSALSYIVLDHKYASDDFMCVAYAIYGYSEANKVNSEFPKDINAMYYKGCVDNLVIASHYLDKLVKQYGADNMDIFAFATAGSSINLQDIYVQKGICEFNLSGFKNDKHFNDAVTSFKTSISKFPKYSEGYNLLGDIEFFANGKKINKEVCRLMKLGCNYGDCSFYNDMCKKQ